MAQRVNYVETVHGRDPVTRPHGFRGVEAWGKGNPRRVVVLRGVWSSAVERLFRKDKQGQKAGRFETGRTFGI